MIESTDSPTTELRSGLPLVLPTRVITYAWGEKYVGDLLSLTLPALLAPSNLPYLAGAVPCELVILTQQRFFARFLADATVIRIQEFCPVRVFALDDLISDPDKYGMALTHVLHRGFADLGSASIDSWLMFLNADFILADGSLRHLLRRLAEGERLVASPSYCVNAEAVKPELLRRIGPHTRDLSLPAREMAGLVLRHRHNTIRGKTVNRPLFSVRYMDQFYWEVDANTLIGHQMPIAIVGMRPERHLSEPNSYWDHGLMREFVPETAPCVIGDSDEFLMLELRSKDVASDQLRLGWPEPAEIARNTLSFLTNYQRDMAPYELTLHARDLPANLDEARQRLRAYVDNVLAHVPPVLPSHIDHPQWNYHRPGFIKTRHEYLSKELGRATEIGEPPAEFSELDRIWWKLDGLKKSHERRRAQLLELRDYQSGALLAVQQRLETQIASQRKALGEELALALGKMPIDRPADDEELDVERVMQSCRHNGLSEMPADHEGPWVTPLGRGAKAWAGFDEEARAKRETIAKALKFVERHYRDRLAMLDLEFRSVGEPVQSEYNRLVSRKAVSAAIPAVVIQPGRKRAISPDSGPVLMRTARKLYCSTFGRLPLIKPWHPYRVALQRLIEALEQADRKGANILLLVGNGELADRLAAALPSRHIQVGLKDALQGNLAFAFNRSRDFDLCICTLEISEICQFPEIVAAVAPCMREGASILGFCPNLDLKPLPIEHPKLLHGLSELSGEVRIFYAGTPQVLRRFRNALLAPSRGQMHALARIAAVLLALGPSSFFASRREQAARSYQLTRPHDVCSSITIEVTV